MSVRIAKNVEIARELRRIADEVANSTDIMRCDVDQEWPVIYKHDDSSPMYCNLERAAYWEMRIKIIPCGKAVPLGVE